MNKRRLESFSDGVIAIIITIMVLEMKAPHGYDLESLKPILPVFISYLLSFIYIGIYWNNHHHMLHLVREVNGKVLWANIHLLFWLSLIPFVTAWMGENHFAKWPVVLYGFNLLMAGCAYFILSQSLIHLHGKKSSIAAAIGADRKGKLSVLIYAAGIGLCFVHPALGFACYLIVTAIWLVPDKRIEKAIGNKQ